MTCWREPPWALAGDLRRDTGPLPSSPCPRRHLIPMGGIRLVAATPSSPRGFAVNLTELEVRPQRGEARLNRSLARAQTCNDDALSELMGEMTQGLLRAI